jgi:hypothetical protein
VDRCYFAKEAPEVELRGGLAFIRPAGAHCEIAITPNGLAEFIASAKIALAEWRIEQSGKVEQINHWRDHAASS